MEFGAEWAFYTGTPPFGLHPCLYSVVPTGLFVCLVLQDILSCFTRHFGLRLGITNKFVLLSACSKIGRTGWRVTLLRSSIRSNVSLQGLRPLGSIPACILTSRWDSCLGYGVVTLLRSSVWKRRFITGVETPACIITSRRDSSFVLFYKTFCLVKQDILGGASAEFK